MLLPKTKVVMACVLAGGVLMQVAPAATVKPRQPAAAPPGQASEPAARAANANSPEERFLFEAENKPLSELFEWLTDMSGLPMVVTYKPTGTFTFIPPRDANQRPCLYTLPEILDIINYALLLPPDSQQYMVIRREQSFTLWPAENEIPAIILRRVFPEDLSKLGRTEMVRLHLPLRTLKANGIVDDLRKWLGPYGKLEMVEQGNQLLLQDMAGNLRRIHDAVNALEVRAVRTVSTLEIQTTLRNK
jgi:type II secretory pathway component GspD/PulD (secretin)